MDRQAGINLQDKISKDIFFLNIEDAYSEAVKQNKIVDDKSTGSPICMAPPPDRVRGMDAPHGKDGERLQYCYYDGLLTDIVLDNFIRVPADSFVEFFAHNHLPIPQIIAISQDGVVHFNEMPIDVIEDINIKRRERDDVIKKMKKFLRDLVDGKLMDLLDRDTYFADPLLALNEAPPKIATPKDGAVYFNDMPADAIEEMNIKRRKRTNKKIKKLSNFLEKDTYFIDPLLALNEAKQKNRVYCGHPTIDGLQVCYYRGGLPLHGIENLVHVELPDLVDFFIVSRLRLPEKVEMPNDLEEELKTAVQEDFANALDAIQKKRQAFTLQLAQKAKALKPVVVEGEPIRVFIPGNRLTTVMQYSSQGVAKAFEKRGCQVLFYIESNDMETSNVVDMLNKYIDFNPHVTFYVNNLKNVFLHDDVINIIWWQDLMPQIKNQQLLNWRKNDFNFSISPIFDPYLKQCGAETVERQHFVIDEEIFYSADEQLRQQKIIFVGSSYLPVVNLANEQQQQVIAELVDVLDRGGRFDQQTVTSIVERSPFNYEFVFWRLLHYVIRDYSVKWLCQNLTLSVEIYGRYWELDPLVAPFYQGELQHGVEVADVYRSATYAIVSHPFEINSQRLVEVAACGCIPVVYDCRDVAEKPHWDDFCLFFKTEEDLKNIIENRVLPAKSPLLLAQSFTYKAAVDHFIEKSAIKTLSEFSGREFIRANKFVNHAEPVLVELFGDNVVLHSQYPNTIQACRDRLIKNITTLNNNRHELFNQLIAEIQSTNIDIVIDKLIESEYWEISLAINGNSYYRLDNIALLENRQLIDDNSNRYKRENTSCYLLLGMGAGYELLEAFKNTERPIQEMGEFEVPVYVIEQEPGQFLLNMLLHDLEDVITSKRVQFFYDKNSIDQFYLELLKHQVALPSVLLDMKVPGDLKAEQVLKLVNQAQHQRNQRHADNLQEINEYYRRIADSEWRDKFKTENIGSLRVMGVISRFSSFLKYCMRDLLDGFDRTGAITAVCSEEENYHLSTIEHFIDEINRFKPDIIITIDHFRHEFDGVPDSVPFVNWIQDMLPNITGNKQAMKAKDFTFVFSKEWLGLNELPIYKNSPVEFLPLGYNDKIYFPIEEKNYDCDVLVVTHLQEPERTFDPIRNPEQFQLVLNENESKLIESGIISEVELIRLYQILDEHLSSLNMSEFNKFCTMRGGDAVHDIKVITVADFNTVFYKKNLTLEPLVMEVLFPLTGNRLHCEYLSKMKTWPVSLLIDSHTNINIHVYGKNWNRYPKFKKIARGIADNGEYINIIMNNARVCLNVSPGITLHMRALEIMASGSFMLSRRNEFDGSPLSNYFSDEQAVLYDDEDDFLSKVRFYLENECERNRVAQNTLSRLQEIFSYKAIAANMLSSLNMRLLG